MSKNYAISFKFSLVDKLTVPAKGLSVTMGGLSQSAKKAARGMEEYNAKTSSMTGSVFKGIIGANLFVKSLSMIKTGFSKVVGEASRIENSLISFTTLLGGSEQAAKKLVGELQILGARTPFEYKDLADATSMLMGFGAATKDTATETLQQLGDLAQGSAARLQGISLAYGQIMAGNKANMQDINQLINNQVPILQQLAKQWGVTTGQAREMVSKGKATGEEISKAFQQMTSEGGMFYKGMERASQSFEGKMSTLSDAINMTAAGIGTALLPVLKDLIDQTTRIAEEVLEWVQSNKQLVSDIITGFVSALKLVFSVMRVAIKIIAKAVSIFWSMRYIIIVVVAAMTAYKAVMLAIIAVEWIKYLWMMRGAILAAVKAQWALNVAMTANPIAAVVAVVVALAAASYLVYEHWDSIVVTLKEAVNAVSKFFGFGDVFKIEKGTTADTAKAAKSMHQSKTETTLLLKAEEGTRATVEKTKTSGGKLKMQTNNGKTLSYTYDGMM